MFPSKVTKRPTIIRPATSSSYQSPGDRHGPSVPARPGLLPPNSKPPLPAKKPATSTDLHTDGQILPHSKSEQLTDLHPKPPTKESKGSVRKRPEITVIGARTLSEVRFREGEPGPSPISTPPPTRVNQSELVKTGDDGDFSNRLSPSRFNPVPFQPKSPLPSSSKSPVPSRPKMPLPSHPKPHVPEESRKGVESGKTLPDEAPQPQGIFDHARDDDISLKVSNHQRTKHPTIIRPSPRPISAALASSHSQFSPNSIEQKPNTPVAAPKPNPKPRSAKYNTDSDLLSEASEQLEHEKFMHEDLQANPIVSPPKKAPPQRPAPSPKLSVRKKVGHFDKGRSSVGSEVPPRPLPSPKLSVRRMDVDSEYESHGIENVTETASATCKTAKPPPRPPPSPKMSIRRIPDENVAGRSTSGLNPKPAVLPKPKLAAKPSISERKETNDWEMIKDSDKKSIDTRCSVLYNPPAKPPRVTPADGEESNDVSPTFLETTASPDSDESLNRSNRRRPPLPKRRSILIGNNNYTCQQSVSDKSAANNSEIRELQNKNDKNDEQILLRRKLSDNETEMKREKPTPSKRYSIDASPLPAVNTRPILHSSHIHQKLNIQKDNSDETSLNEGEKINSKLSPPLPNRKYPPKCDSFDEESICTQFSPEKPDTLSITNRSLCIDSNKKPSLCRTKLNVESNNFNNNQESSRSFPRYELSEDEQNKDKSLSPISHPPLPPRASSASTKSLQVSVSSKSNGENCSLIKDGPLQDLDQLKSENKEGVVQLRPSRPKARPSRPLSMPIKSQTSGNLSVFERKSMRPDKLQPSRTSPNKVDSLETPTLPRRPLPGHPLYHYMVQGPKGTALFDYESNQPDELSFKTGEIIMLVDRIDPSWLMGKIGDRQGIFPQNFIDVLQPLPNEGDHVTEETINAQSTIEKPDLISHGPRCQARFDFDSDGTNDLTFEEGDVIRIIENVGDDWLRGELSGINGIFPLSFVEIIEDLPVDDGNKTNATFQDDRLVTALFDFEGQEKELKFLAGDKITVLSQMNMEWLYGEINAIQGLFPSTFVDRVPSGLLQYQPIKVKTQQAIAITDRPHCTALFDYLGETKNDLQFEAGQKIELLKHINADWLRGRTNDKEGVFPASFVQIEMDIPDKKPEKLRIGKAMYDFLGQNENELTFKVGDKIVLQEMLKGDANWQRGEMSGKWGIFPTSFVEALN